MSLIAQKQKLGKQKAEITKQKLIRLPEASARQANHSIRSCPVK